MNRGKDLFELGKDNDEHEDHYRQGEHSEHDGIRDRGRQRPAQLLLSLFHVAKPVERNRQEATDFRCGNQVHVGRGKDLGVARQRASEGRATLHLLVQRHDEIGHLALPGLTSQRDERHLERNAGFQQERESLCEEHPFAGPDLLSIELRHLLAEASERGCLSAPRNRDELRLAR